MPFSDGQRHSWACSGKRTGICGKSILKVDIITIWTAPYSIIIMIIKISSKNWRPLIFGYSSSFEPKWVSKFWARIKNRVISSGYVVICPFKFCCNSSCFFPSEAPYGECSISSSSMISISTHILELSVGCSGLHVPISNQRPIGNICESIEIKLISMNIRNLHSF